MPNDDLTFVEKSILLILMAEGTEVPNTVLTTKYRLKVEVATRDKLKRLGLIAVRTENRRVFVELRDLGGKRALEELGADVTQGVGAGGAALYATLAVIRRYLDRCGISHEDFYQPVAEQESAVGRAEIEARIRKAYGKLVRRPGEWAKLADLRELLGSLPRQEVDAVLVVMNRTPSVNIVPESNQKTLTKRDREAAVIIGNQDKHAISIGS